MKLKILIPVSILLFSLSFILLSHIYVTSNASKEVEYATNILRREVLLRASLIEAAYNRGDMHIAYGYLKGFTTDPEIRTTRLIDAKGKILLSLSPSEEGKNIYQLFRNSITDSRIQQAFAVNTPFIHYDEKNMILEIASQLALTTSRHSLRPDTNALLIVHRDLTRDFVVYQHRETILTYIIATVFSVLSLFIWLILDRQITKPINLIQNVTRRIAAGEFDARTGNLSSNEIGNLATDINRMAEALQHSQSELAENIARLQTSQTYGAIGIWEWNIETDKVTWSDVVYQIFGADPNIHELNFDSYLSFINETDRESAKQAFIRCMEDGNPFEVRHRVLKDGVIRWVMGRGNVTRDDSGKPLRMLGTVQDITQQVNYEHDIKTAYDELNHQITSLNQHSIVSVTNANGVITYANPKFVKISGYSEQELIGNTHQLLNSNYHGPEFWKQLWKTISSGQIWEGEIRDRDKNGQHYWVKTTIVPHLNEAGEPDRYTSIQTDITALKIAQDVLSKDHDRLQAITAIKNAYMYSQNQQQVFQEILQIYLDNTESEIGFIGSVKYQPEEKQNTLTSLAMTDISWDEASEEIYRKHLNGAMVFSNLNSLYGHVLATGEPYISNEAMHSPYYNHLPDGHPELNNFCGMPLYYGREFIGMIGFANRHDGYTEDDVIRLQPLNDEVARIIHEVRLQQHNRRLLHAINNSSSEIFVIDPVTLRILDANPTACKNMGYDLEELKHLHVPEITALSDSERKQLLDLNKDNYELISENEHIRKDGTRYAVEGRIQLITDELPYVLVAIIQDISERKASEQQYHEIQKQLFQSQKMEALGHLTGGIAHDFNNMLASILGYSELSLDLIESDNANVGKIQGYLGQVITASKRARDLITQMLSFSRTKTDTQDHVTDVKPVISEVITLLRSSLPATMKLDYSIENNLPAAHIQPIQLHQILMNLCINARDAMQGVGEVQVEASRCSPVASMCNGCHKRFSGDYVCIKVIDTGSGIPVESLERIFEPFYTTKETGKGTGMGLSVVHGIVHGNNGHIQVESVYGEGTTFMIYLPVSERHDSVDDTHSSLYAPGRLGGTRAIVVDDDISVGNFLKEMLELNEVKTRYFNDSLAALEHLRQNHADYDVLISDMTMPNLTGLQLVEELSHTGSQLPAILCSGYNSEKIDQQKCEQLGIRSCLTKPIDTRVLLGIIGEIADKKKSLQG